MQEEEGFANENTTEFEELHFIPSFTAAKYKPKIYSNPLKLINITPLYNSSLFMDSALTKELTDRFHNKYHSHIIYPRTTNNHNNNVMQRGLQFDSNYEGANLQYVISEDYKQYDLYMKPDTNTSMHFQWFCFKVRNRNCKHVSFSIKNFAKKHMLYSNGLRPYFRKTSSQNGQYLQLETQVKYELSRESQERSLLYQLHFSFNFAQQNQEFEFCSQPTYTLQRFQKVFRFSPFVKITFAKTVLGHPIHGYLLNELENCKAVVVVFARQHPGETAGSWLIEGFVGKLFDLDHSNIYWIIVPMINIDGVVLGNNRTGMLGFDFNRHWYIDQETNRAELFPQIMGIVRYFKKRKKEFLRKTKLFIDFHGHSSQENVFAYGPPHHKTSELYETSRLLPYLINKRNPDFSVAQCSYEVSPQKKHCARAVFHSKFGFQYSYTIESSFGVYNGRRVNEKDMSKMGSDICETALQFIRLVSADKEKDKYSLNEVLTLMRNQYVSKFVDPCDDSDSQEEGKTTSCRDFQDKVFNILSKNPREEQQTELISKNRLRKGLDSSEQSETNKEKEGLKMLQSLRYKHKTQQSLESKRTIISKNSSVFLPKIRRMQRGISLHTDNSSVLDCSLENMSLSQIKVRLMNLRNSKLGKRILIIH